MKQIKNKRFLQISSFALPLTFVLTVLVAACSSVPVKNVNHEVNQNIDAEPVYAESNRTVIIHKPSTSVPKSAPMPREGRTQASSKVSSTNQSQRPNPFSGNQVFESERLGTKWGDEISSYVTQSNLKRLSAQPVSEVVVRYANKRFDGLKINSISLAAGKISFSITDDAGRPLPLYREGNTYYLPALDGQNYQLRYRNHSGQTFEVSASVDGLNVVTGKQASRQQEGYVLSPYSQFAIEGFRKSNSAVAAFTFSKPKDSYAANTSQGKVQNTGIIGTVIHELNAPIAKAPSSDTRYAPAPNAFPADR